MRPSRLPAARSSTQCGRGSQPTAYELERVKSGGVRWEVVLRIQVGRRGDRRLDDQARRLGARSRPESKRWRHSRRPISFTRNFSAASARSISSASRPCRSLNDVQQFIAQALRVVEAGQWTAHEDLAELAGTTAAEVAHFLASWKVQIPNAYRVLNADGSIPDEGMLNASYRGTDLRKRLAQEGLAFDQLGQAIQEQRLSAEALKELLDALREAESEAESAPVARRAWMVRGANVDGYNLVPQWLRDGYRLAQRLAARTIWSRASVTTSSSRRWRPHTSTSRTPTAVSGWRNWTVSSGGCDGRSRAHAHAGRASTSARSRRAAPSGEWDAITG